MATEKVTVAPHCKDTIPKIRIKYSQKRNCAAPRYSPNSYIHVSVSDLYIPLIGLPIQLQENRWTELENLQIAHRHINVEIGTEVAQFIFWEYINLNFFAVQELPFLSQGGEAQDEPPWPQGRVSSNSSRVDLQAQKVSLCGPSQGEPPRPRRSLHSFRAGPAQMALE